MKIAIIGCGVMGAAFARHFSRNHSLILSDRNAEKTKVLSQELNATCEKEASLAMNAADVILLAVKPKDLASVSKACISVPFQGKIVISILAGIDLSRLHHAFPKATVVRAMPNLALLCGKGVIGVAQDEHMAPETKESLCKLFDGMGVTLFLPEHKMEALTAVAGSGVGFVLAMMEAMMAGGVLLGLTAKEAEELACQTFEGAAALTRFTGQHPAVIRSHICSPGGTTIAGLRAFEKCNVRSGIIETLVACHEREKEMQR